MIGRLLSLSALLVAVSGCSNPPRIHDVDVKRGMFTVLTVT